jgi:signal transduction histidine kinase
MSWVGWTASAVAVLATFAVGVAVGLTRGRTRLARVSRGVEEFARGNLGHRIMLAGGDPAARMAAGLDELADSLQREHEAVTARDEGRREFIANISHDLRTPITSIAGYADALQRGLGEQPDRYPAVIAAKAEELAQLTDDLFYAARLDAGDLELRRTSLDLAEAVRRSLLGFEPQLVSTGARVEVRVPEEACVVEGDDSAVARILANLISNAIRHAQGMTAFSVMMTHEAVGFVVRVANDGATPMVDADALFDRGATGPAGGTGLGLSIARELAQRMGASVTGQSRPEGGAVFALSFPATPPEFRET